MMILPSRPMKLQRSRPSIAPTIAESFSERKSIWRCLYLKLAPRNCFVYRLFMPQFYDIGGAYTKAEATAALANIVPPHIRQKLRFQEPMMLVKLQAHLPNWFAHEVNRSRGLAFTSGEHGFSHTRE
jgi:hypothetical protein